MATPKADTKPRAHADGIPVYCAYDEIVPIGQLRPNPKNPNKHPQDQIEKLGKIIRGNGWRNPITVSTRSGLIVKGHGRLLTAELEELKEVPVEYQNYESDEAELADLTADNRIAELAEMDSKMLADIFADIDTGSIDFELSGYSEEEYNVIATALSEAVHNDVNDPDDVPEAPEPENTITQTGDLWILGNHRVMCGDSTVIEDVDELLDGKKADMVFTDPPYALMGNSTGVSGVGDDKMILPFFRDIAKVVRRAVKPMGHIYACHDWQTSATIAHAFQMGNASAELQLIPKNLIVLRKAEAGGLGTFYTKIYELIWLFANEPAKGIIGKNKVPARTIHGVANIWDCPVVQAPERDHNAQKPVDIIKIAVENSSDFGESVLDLFGGSGSTLIASEELGRTCYMMEMEPRYCDVIVKRYIRATGSDRVKCIRNGEQLPREDIAGIFEIKAASVEGGETD